MKEFLKKNYIILIALSLPLVLIIVVALSTFIPSRLLSTNYNFIYASCNDSRNYYYYSCNDFLAKRYSVVDDKLVVNQINPTQDSDGDKIPDIQENYSVHIFLHDTKSNTDKEVSLKEAQGLNLNDLLTSPDGVTVSSGYEYSYRGDDFFPFPFGGSSSSYGLYLTKGKSKQKLNLVNENNGYYYYPDNFHFLGWVLPGRN